MAFPNNNNNSIGLNGNQKGNDGDRGWNGHDHRHHPHPQQDQENHHEANTTTPTGTTTSTVGAGSGDGHGGIGGVGNESFRFTIPSTLLSLPSLHNETDPHGSSHRLMNTVIPPLPAGLRAQAFYGNQNHQANVADDMEAATALHHALQIIDSALDIINDTTTHHYSVVRVHAAQ